MSVTVRPATKTDVPAGATVLADAFFDDPVMAWMWPDEGRREHGLRRYFAAEARFHSVPVGGADIAERDEIVGGAALWGPPVHGSRRYGSRFACGPGSRSHSAVTRAPESPSAQHSRPFIPPNRTATHAPAYLEPSKEVNIGYYERFGFEVTREIVIPRGGPTLWAMWRNPR
ncbi:GNAT family N-acetyltransferase [Rhodococcus sp. 7Tela_A2]|uniref:GNAT family N-acetyltransferase n=1 Tax=Rhodococcus sp. 7Tela_A2 TaxID=3093744 RepID=UPI003BB569FB